jgi:predicted nucleic-acid-binding protein
VIALDTNVLVRFLVEDDPRQSKAATALIGRAIARNEPLFISDVVLCELVWVLAGSYDVRRERIVATLRDLLRARHLRFATAEVLRRAVESYAESKGDFADYLIREHGRAAGCSAVATFDRALLRDEGFVAP